MVVENNHKRKLYCKNRQPLLKFFLHREMIVQTWISMSHRTVARKFSIGGLCSSAKGLCVCLGGLDIIKLTKTRLIYSVSRFNFGGLELCLGGLSPPKPLRGDGTDVTPQSQTAGSPSQR